MTFVPAAGICEVFIEHSVNDVANIGWVVHYEKSSGVWGPDLFDDLGDALRVWWNTHMKPLCSTTTILQRFRFRDLTTQNGAIGDYTDGLPLTGTATGQPASNNVSLSVKKNTGLAGKNYRGRIYQLGLTENNVVGNFVDSTYRSALLAAWTEALFLSGGLADYGMVLVSKYANGAPRAAAVITDVTSVSLADTRVDTRRDRL